jgi:hypothetical protein
VGKIKVIFLFIMCFFFDFQKKGRATAPPQYKRRRDADLSKKR